MMENVWHCFSITLSIIASIFYIYYKQYVIHKPILFANARFKDLLLATCPVLKTEYHPTFWCYEGRCQTLAARIFLPGSAINSYSREILQLKDGGQVGLDWVYNTGNEMYKDEKDRPVVIFLPGLSGSSGSGCFSNYVTEATVLGYRSVVFNYRGQGGVELKTPRSYSGANIEDLSAVIKHVKTKYPTAPLIATGVSLGGIMLGNYLSHTGKESHLLAAFIVSTPWNVFETKKSLEQPINKFLFDTQLCIKLKKKVKLYQHLLQKDDGYDIDHILKSETIRELDDRLTSKMFGYPSWKEHYEDMTLYTNVDLIKIPLLAVNAADDPFAPDYSLPLQKISRSKYVALALTQYGGHVAHLEGMFPYKASYIDGVFSDYIYAVVKYKEDFQTVWNTF